MSQLVVTNQEVSNYMTRLSLPNCHSDHTIIQQLPRSNSLEVFLNRATSYLSSFATNISKSDQPN